VSACQQGVGEAKAKEAGAAGDENSRGERGHGVKQGETREFMCRLRERVERAVSWDAKGV